MRSRIHGREPETWWSCMKGRQFTMKTRRSVTHPGQTRPQDHHIGSLLHIAPERHVHNGCDTPMRMIEGQQIRSVRGGEAMGEVAVEVVFAELLGADPAVADRDEVASIVRRTGQLRSWLASIVVRCARRTSELAAAGQSEPAESLLGDEGNRSSRDAVGITRRTHACDAMPSFEDALAAGLISGDHVDAVARVLRGLDAEVRAEFISHEAVLLVAATRERIVMFDRTCRDLAKCLVAERDRRAGIDTEAADFERERAAAKTRQWVDKDTGMHHTHVELDRERGTRLADALRVHLRRIVKQDGNSGRPYGQLEVDAFMAALESGVTRRPTAGRRDAAGNSDGRNV